MINEIHHNFSPIENSDLLKCNIARIGTMKLQDQFLCDLSGVLYFLDN